MNGMKNILINLVVALVTGSLVFAFTMLTVVTTVNSTVKDNAYTAKALQAEIDERKWADGQLETHLSQNSDLMRVQIEQCTQLIALLKVQNQLLRN